MPIFLPPWAEPVESPDARPIDSFWPRIRDRRTEMELIAVPSGVYERGAADDEADSSPREKPRHTVVLTRSFYLGRFPVRQCEWEKVADRAVSKFRGAALPVESVDFSTACSFASALGGRLPTEAEWEYACRAGSTEPTFGDPLRIAWTKENAEGRTREVGQKSPNAWGFHDMLGNVWEWTADFFDAETYAASASASPVVDPKGPKSGTTRVVRGGSWSNTAPRIRAAYRMYLPEDSRAANLGFRLAFDLDHASALAID